MFHLFRKVTTRGDGSEWAFYHDLLSSDTRLVADDFMLKEFCIIDNVIWHCKTPGIERDGESLSTPYPVICVTTSASVRHASDSMKQSAVHNNSSAI